MMTHGLTNFKLSTIVHHEVCPTYRDKLHIDKWLTRCN